MLRGGSIDRRTAKIDDKDEWPNDNRLAPISAAQSTVTDRYSPLTLSPVASAADDVAPMTKFRSQLSLRGVSTQQQQRNAARRPYCVLQLAKRRACARRPLLSVGLIAGRAAAAAWRPGRAGPGRARRAGVSSAATHCTHEYNWSITTSRALYHTRSRLASVRPSDRCLHGSLTKAARSLSASVRVGLYGLRQPQTHVRHTVGKGRRCRGG